MANVLGGVLWTWPKTNDPPATKIIQSVPSYVQLNKRKHSMDWQTTFCQSSCMEGAQKEETKGWLAAYGQVLWPYSAGIIHFLVSNTGLTP